MEWFLNISEVRQDIIIICTAFLIYLGVMLYLYIKELKVK